MKVRFESQDCGIRVADLALRFHYGCSGLLADLAVLSALKSLLLHFSSYFDWFWV